MAPSRFGSFRGRPSPEQHLRRRPSFDSAGQVTISNTSSGSGSGSGSGSADGGGGGLQQLVALPYDKMVQAEPPIPIPPPRNPLRLSRRPSTPPPPPPPPATARLTTIPSNTTIVVPPPVVTSMSTSMSTSIATAAPSFFRHGLPSIENSPWHSHSASISISTTCTDWKRDSAWGTISSAATTVSTAASTTLQDESEPVAGGPTSTAHVPRYSCQSRWSLSESDVSDSDPDDNKDETTTRRLIRGLSLRLAPPMKRSKKQARGDVAGAVAVAVAVAATEFPCSPPPLSSSASRHSRESHHSRQQHPHQHPHQHHLQGSPAGPQLSTSPNFPPAPSPANHERRQRESQSPIASESGPLSDANLSSVSAPTINTDIPEGCFLDDDVLDSINFSNRGSVYFGGKRAISAPVSVLAPTSMDTFADPRAAPPAPSAAFNDAVNPHPATSDATSTHTSQVKNPTLPDIRVMSVDTERESQKVRSLYESGDLIDWQDGAPARQSAEPLESPVGLASDGEDNTAITTGREHRKSVRALYLCPISPLSVTSLPPPRGNARRNEFELAGGIEDWEDVHGEDVDRYGFITVDSQRPVSRHSTPAETCSLYTTPGRRKGRNVLTKKHRGPPLSSGLSRIPSRKVSARSLQTQASAVSVSSRLSVRSGIRTAANILPHNRDRRIIDAAGDMLSLPPGLAGVEDEQKSAQATKAAQEREVRRTEKWRKMAKIVTKVKDGKGAEFDIHTMSKKVKKEMSTDGKHFQIQGMNIEFDTKHPKLVERTWKGIPDRWRAAAWYYFLSVSDNAQSDPTEEQLFVDFHRLQETSSSDDVQIDLDVPRTINRHIMFRKRYRGGQRLLFRVLHALSLYFPETGYVQGMAALAASLLCYYDEERCFVMLVRLWKHRGLARLYQPGFAGLMIALQDLEKYWLKGKQVSEKLNELGIDPTAYGTRWYLTLFNLSIPFPAQLRVWDVFMLLGGIPIPPPTGNGREKEKAKEPEDEEMSFHGLDIIHATAAALIDMHKDVIIGGDFENVMKGLTSFQDIKDEDRFMSLVRAEWNMHRGKRRG